MPCRICSCKLYRLPCYNGMQFKEHLEMDMAHIISSHLRFDLIEMYLPKKQRLKCIWVLIDQTIVANFFVANYLNPFELFWREIFRHSNYKQIKMRMPRKISQRNRHSFHLMEICLNLQLQILHGISRSSRLGVL